MTTTILGVRHHGPGSAKAVRAELERLKPDIVLIEGPPEADDLVKLAADPDMEPPVALLAHVPGDPSKAAFWPFAVFSPEWQAIQYAVDAGVEVRFCDLPAAHSLAAPQRTEEEAESTSAEETGKESGQESGGETDPSGDVDPATVTVPDPIGALAAAAGYDDPERWWEDVVEHAAGQQRSGPAAAGQAAETPFEVIAEAMAEVREGHVPDGHEARREAYMRRTLRQAGKDGFTNVAVVCGAWHAPALAELGPAAADDRLLKGMPKVKVDVTWVPWTHGRLAARSGYGAGVSSPGWYHHVFECVDRPIERWLTKAAAVLRDEDLAVSSAHVIEAVRLAHSLATLRGRPLPGLAEVTEATRAVLCEGDDLPVELVQRRLVVGELLGHVPDTTPMVPLQRHLRDEQRRLKLKPEALSRDCDLDLRKPIDLERSRLLHRLSAIGVAWGVPREARGKGTFKESWTLEWRPEFDISLIEAAGWGTTVHAAATTRILDFAGRSAVALADLTSLVERCLLADLPEALPLVLRAIDDRAALDGDVRHLMAALPALVRAQRYGDVRGTPPEGLERITHTVLARVCAGLSPAVTGLDDDSAREVVAEIDAVHAAIAPLPDRERWLAALTAVADRSDVPGMIEGRLVRILFDARVVDDVPVRMARSMSAGNPAARTGAWIEGFLSEGGLLLVHDARLLAMIDEWLTALAGDAFIDVLPLLRRTFGAFDPPERRSIAARVRSGAAPVSGEAADYDDDRAAPAVQTVLTILGTL